MKPLKFLVHESGRCIVCDTEDQRAEVTMALLGQGASVSWSSGVVLPFAEWIREVKVPAA